MMSHFAYDSPRSQFPFLASRPNLVYLDSASTTQKPEVVLRAMDRFYREQNANVHRGVYPLSEQATVLYEGAREIVRGFVGAKESEEIIFTRGTTEALNMVAQGWGGQNLKQGDEVLLTVMEHHSNLVPWQMVAKRTGAMLKFAPLKGDARKGGVGLDYEAMEKLITPRTKIVSVTGLSNALGTVVNLVRVVGMARKVGAKVCADAAQLAAHFPIDVQKLDVDFLAFSGHKVYGPTGVGVLYAKREILENMEPWLGGGDMIREVSLERSTWNDLPWKFEAGTPPIAEIIGLGAALEFLKSVGWDFVRAHDVELMQYAVECLRAIKGVTLFAVDRSGKSGDSGLPVGSLSFEVEGVHAHDVSAILGERGVCVRGGHHCCMPLMKELGVTGTCRMSFGAYNEKSDIDRLADGLEKVCLTFQ